MIKRQQLLWSNSKRHAMPSPKTTQQYAENFAINLVGLAVLSFIFDYRALPFMSPYRWLLSLGNGGVIAALMFGISWLMNHSPRYLAWKQRLKDKLRKKIIDRNRQKHWR